MKIELLEAKNPAQDVGDLQLYGDLYRGGSDLWARLDRYLPKRPQETPERWAGRKGRAFYVPLASGMIDYFAANVFASGSKITLESGDEVPEVYRDFLANVDGRGKDWDFFWRKVLTRALIDQWLYVGISFPAPPPIASEVEGDEEAGTARGLQIASLADEEAAGLNVPILTTIKRCSINDWELDDARKLKWIIIESCFRDRPFPVEARAGTDAMKKSWILVESGQITSYAKPVKPLPGTEKDAVQTGAYPIKNFPLINFKIPRGMWVMGQCATMFLAIFRKWCDLANALYMGAYPMPVFKTEKEMAAVLGEGYSIHLGREDNASILEPGGQSYQHLMNDLEAIKNETHRVTHQMALSANSASRSAQSGESKLRDHGPTLIMLRAYAQIVREKMEETLNRIAELRGDIGEDGEPMEFSVSGLDEFDPIADFNSYLENVALARALIPSGRSPTFDREIQTNIALKVVDNSSEEVKSTIIEELKTEPEPPAETPSPFDAFRGGRMNGSSAAPPTQNGKVPEPTPKEMEAANAGAKG